MFTRSILKFTSSSSYSSSSYSSFCSSKYFFNYSTTSSNKNFLKMTLPSVTINEKVERLRELMKKQSLAAYVVPSEDAHQSEYITVRDKRREYISGFSGSAGTAVITTSECLLWTDGRYWLQAAQQLEPNWLVMKDRVQGEPTIEEWLAKRLTPGSGKVGIDSKLISKSYAERFEKVLEKSKHQVDLNESNLIDQVRESFSSVEPIPSYPTDPVFHLAIEYTGQSYQDKLSTLRSQLDQEKADYIVISALDEIAWLYNLRGSDISFNPVFISYAIIGKDSSELFILESKIPENVKNQLPGVQIKPYDSIFSTLSQYNQEKKKIWLDPRSSLALFRSVDKSQLIEKSNPVQLAKAIKNQVEIEGFRKCHVRDASALVQFLAWLEEEIVVKNNTELTEYSVAEVLEEYRSRQKDFISLSFDSISSIESNGAIIHYKPEKETCKKITKAMYLIDSGGQYRDGTTDVTRTTHYGQPTQHEKDCYTRVLKGHIQLSIIKFPQRISGRDIDCIARMSLWQVGLDYAHGTGHGVGSFLNVHEGPQGISYRSIPNPTLFQQGMTITNEPGYYEAGAFGIRIENIMVTQPTETKFNNGAYLGFESVTVVPYERDLINLDLLTTKEITFINQYHQQVLQKILPTLDPNDHRTINYLKKKTIPL
ncbi:peptidase M24 family protein [Cavenderia fasciculata]|uniref:Peptidase M24 family protein n=1 Tax=Cavenderia fasciculata TaxID=261658 RepID=F4QDX9_CACFS|nr:peptidase M24 family protein [Cavenderia fasciculata]EGG13926.1 peptidase M24 family protein [Cavenderia fasciculata]|eukprot:XP_004350634.1 peptidase M24 family protein [Cavenderia fasciculata]